MKRIFEPLFSSLDPSLDPFREAVTSWLIFVVTDPLCNAVWDAMPGAEAKKIVDLILSESVLNAMNPWAVELAKEVVKMAPDHMQQHWRDLLGEAMGEVDADSVAGAEGQWEKKVQRSVAQRKRQFSDANIADATREHKLDFLHSAEQNGERVGWKRRRR